MKEDGPVEDCMQKQYKSILIIAFAAVYIFFVMHDETIVICALLKNVFGCAKYTITIWYFNSSLIKKCIAKFELF